ncbi:hypothetical protein BJX99DRAFT_225477, partial [Aspergillus californicus]
MAQVIFNDQHGHPVAHNPGTLEKMQMSELLVLRLGLEYGWNCRDIHDLNMHL